MSWQSQAREGRNRPSFLASEVVQTSSMDCGPAALKSLLDGFGVSVSYDRLREACQTSLDGTSIDTMEEVASLLGLNAEQVMLPADHILLPEARALPAIAVVRLPMGTTHFVLIWRRFGDWVQIMDPAVGRRWLRARQLKQELYQHSMFVPARAWRDWAEGKEFRAALTARARAIGASVTVIQSWIRRAAQEAGWRALGALDAALRMVTGLVKAGSLAAGNAAVSLVEELQSDALSCKTGGCFEIPERYWSVRPAKPEPESGEEQLLLTGAVLVRVRGLKEDLGESSGAESARQREERSSLAGNLQSPATRPFREMMRQVREGGWLAPGILVGALAVSAFTVLLELLLFRGLFDLSQKLVVIEQRALVSLGLVTFLVSQLVLEVPLFQGLYSQGRRLEVRMRLAFLRKLPALGDPYFRSRLSSDMAERGHSAHALRMVPEMVGLILRIGFQALMMTVGLVWLDSTLIPLACLVLFLTLVLPALAQPVLAERELRMRTHRGTLSRFYLDALLGLVPLRNHAAERPLRREHEGLLKEWFAAALRFRRSGLVLEFLQAAFGYGLAIAIVVHHVFVSGGGQVLLVAYWALRLPILGGQLSKIAQQYPALRNSARRMLEPLAAVEEFSPASQSEPVSQAACHRREPVRGVGVSLQGVAVDAGGHRILEDIDLRIEPGDHVALVGPSGAGKSSLLGLLLGWLSSVEGTVAIDGEPLSPESVVALRRQTAWVDPAIQLWNRSLLENLTYGAPGKGQPPVDALLEAALLKDLLQGLPEGLQTILGESGGLVSGGEGQRVRLARAFMRRDARLVLLDEPFRGLDAEMRRALLQRARQWWPTSTLLFVTHDIASTCDFPRVLVVQGGRLVESGDPRQLLNDDTTQYREMFDREVAVRESLYDGVWQRLELRSGQLSAEKSSVGTSHG